MLDLRRRLEADIRDAELRIVDADRKLATHAAGLREQARHALALKLVAGAGLFAGGWLLRRPPRAQRGTRRASRATLPLARWAPMLLPLVAPLLDRKLALTLAGLGVPIAARAVAPLRTAPDFDLERFGGLWYEVARLPRRGERGASDTVLHYNVDDQGLTVVRRTRDADGRLSDQVGRGRAASHQRPAELEVSFAPAWARWWPGAWIDHWVLYLDADYSVALVGGPERDGLWLLAREPDLPDEALQALLALAEKLGFDRSRVQRTPQATP